MIENFLNSCSNNCSSQVLEWGAELLKKEATMQEPVHKPVMLQEVLSLLNLRDGMTVLDGTVGLGGHASKIVEKIAPHGRVICVDKDEEALKVAQNTLKDFLDNCIFIHDDFRNMDKILDRLGIPEVDVVLLDLGVSSYQLDNPSRGFSIKSEGPLDMRMDRNSFILAYDLINTLTEEEISSIIWKFGQERFSRRIAKNIVAARKRAPISTTRELAELVEKSLPYKARFYKIHPATRTFQALRIAVNRELDSLDEVLLKTASYIKRGGRICVIAFHSLEDKIVKDRFRELVKTNKFSYVFKKILRPSPEETRDNPRSRSARMRMIERIK